MTMLNNQEWQGIPIQVRELLDGVDAAGMSTEWSEFVSIKNAQEISSLICENAVLVDFSDDAIELALDIVFTPLLQGALMDPIIQGVGTYLQRSVTLGIGEEPEEEPSFTVKRKRAILSYAVEYWRKSLEG